MALKVALPRKSMTPALRLSPRKDEGFKGALSLTINLLAVKELVVIGRRLPCLGKTQRRTVMSTWRFWRHVFAWLAVALCISGIAAASIIKHQHNHAVQLRWQTALLAELSDYESQEPNHAREDSLLQETAALIRGLSIDEAEEFEMSLIQKMNLLSIARRIHIIRLIENYEGYVVSSLGGNVSPARRLETEWMTRRHPSYLSEGFFPTILFVFIFGYIGLAHIADKANKGHLKIEDLELRNKGLEGEVETLRKERDRLAEVAEELRKKDQDPLTRGEGAPFDRA